ncbi:MAG TPA: 2-C-methyl-D-erythritol 2,4-cyclodiphosphate synthase [Chloroflexota bacterium]|nr:2-C-methyl-D-erythritol 2,4-cyclodiphosphate synthase [Chloroflexota bacterium]
MPVGIGYDVHQLVPGRRLVLGGVEFPGDRGLLGHSDADVATHAVMDALLGAAALGDIGQLFPPSDARYEAARSVELLRQVVRLLAEHQWCVGNVDLTIVAEWPKIGPRATEMRRQLGEALGIGAARVSVKATTNEGLGFIGRGEGIAALAVAEIVRPESTDSTLAPSARSERHG